MTSPGVRPVRDIAPIRIAGLHLPGVSKDYGISFKDEDGEIRSLSIIAGEISTGKTSILEFIDYCLGASPHPQHEEILDAVRGARLALEVRELTASDAVDANVGAQSN